MSDFYTLLAAYLLGSIPSGYIFTHLLTGGDIRHRGSGNIGAMNTLRNAGFLPGLLTVTADLGKGALAVYLARTWGTWPILPIICGLLAVLGHNFQFYFAFRHGGKGLAATVGALLALVPWTAPLFLGTIGILALLLKDTNTAAGAAALIIPLLFLFTAGGLAPLLLGTAWAITIIIRHLPDFQAYRQGRRRLI